MFKGGNFKKLNGGIVEFKEENYLFYGRELFILRNGIIYLKEGNYLV